MAVGDEEKAALAEATRNLVCVKRNDVELTVRMQEALGGAIAKSAKTVEGMKPWNAKLLGAVGADLFKEFHSEDAGVLDKHMLEGWAADAKPAASAGGAVNLFDEATVRAIRERGIAQAGGAEPSVQEQLHEMERKLREAGVAVGPARRTCRRTLQHIAYDAFHSVL